MKRVAEGNFCLFFYAQILVTILVTMSHYKMVFIPQKWVKSVHI